MDGNIAAAKLSQEIGLRQSGNASGTPEGNATTNKQSDRQFKHGLLLREQNTFQGFVLDFNRHGHIVRIRRNVFNVS